MNTPDKLRLSHFFPIHESKFEQQAKRFFTRDYLSNDWVGFSRENINQLAATFCEGNHSKTDWVVFHSAPNYAVGAISSISKKSRVLVQFWGADYASILIPESRLFLERTRLEFIGRPFPKILSIELLKYRWFLFKNRYRRHSYLKAFETCEHLCFGCGDAEWKWMPTNLQSKRLNWFVNYSTGNTDTWQTYTVGSQQRDGLLIGNSAAATNNHLDVFEKLSQATNLPKKIIIPLSYGSEVIAERTKKLAKMYFGSAAMPIMEFMPTQAYFDLLSQCEFVIMGHMRQQALGNLKWAFSTLRTVYLWEDSDMYEHFISQGFAIRTINSIERMGLVPIASDKLEKNRALAREDLLNFFEGDVKMTLFNPIL